MQPKALCQQSNPLTIDMTTYTSRIPLTLPENTRTLALDFLYARNHDPRCVIFAFGFHLAFSF